VYLNVRAVANGCAFAVVDVSNFDFVAHGFS
jgi:hypothetical protein